MFKKKKPYKFKPNISFYNEDRKIVWKVYAERGEELEKTIAKAKKEFNAVGYMAYAVTGRTAYFNIRRKKKRWGSNY